MKNYRTFLLLLLLAIVLITLFSCCSWIYPLQPVDDANTYMSIAKSMLSGKLLYTDVHDQKGPLLFFLHEWAAVLSSKSFFGIYLLEILCCFGFLKYSYKTMRLFAEHSICLVGTCLVGVLAYTSDFMWYGDTVEELSLPILLIILYKALRYAKLDELPKNGESVIIGIGIAVIFWMKFTVLAMCVGVFAALFILAWQRNQMSQLLQCLTWCVAGAGALTACILLYFVVNDNEADLYHSYFYFNIFLYTRGGGTPEAWWTAPFKWIGWAFLVNLVLTRRMSVDVKILVTLCWGAALLPFVLFKVYLYYFLTIFVFAPLLVYYLRIIHSQTLFIVGATIVTIFATFTNFNLMTLLSGNFPKAVLPLAEIVNADNDDKQVLTVKSYDTGIYTLTDCLPPIKYFVTPNAYTEELIHEQTNYLESCKAKYVIMKTDSFAHYYGDFQPNLTRDYELVQETSCIYRTEFLLHPLEFLWSLGYMNRLIERIYSPEQRKVIYRLYKCKHAVKDDFYNLLGEWLMKTDKGQDFSLNFTKYNLIRCKEFEVGKLKSDKTYSFTYRLDNLKLGYMFTGEEYKSVRIIELSQAKLVLRGWPIKGNCTFTKQQKRG